MESFLVRGWRWGLKPLILKITLALAASAAAFLTARSRPRRLCCPPPDSKVKDEESLLLPEFDDLISSEFNPEGIGFKVFDDTIDAKEEEEEKQAMEDEVHQLRDLVVNLEERVRELESELLEYYGMEEQGSAEKELRNRLNVGKVEVELLSTKVKSLQAENDELRARVFGYSCMTNELEASTSNIKLLRRKLETKEGQARETIASLNQRIAMLEGKNFTDSNYAEVLVEKVKGLEEEVDGLRGENSRMSKENMAMMKSMNSLPKHVSSDHNNGQEVEVLKEAAHLREMNDKLSKELEQLRTDHFADVEELIYFRWINACLRYELRNYNPPDGKMLARDLSKCLSPNSEDRVKHLILEYANSGIDDRPINLFDFDTDCWSLSSQASNGEVDDTSVGFSSTTKGSGSSKSKFINKLKKLVLQKGTRINRASSEEKTPVGCNNAARGELLSPCFSKDATRRCSCRNNKLHCLFRQSSRGPFIPELNLDELSRCKSDLGTSYDRGRLILDGKSGLDFNCFVSHEDSDDRRTNWKKSDKDMESSHSNLKSKKRTMSFS